MAYVMGFVTPIPTAGRDAFVAHARRAAAMCRRLGAARVVDAWGNDVPAGRTNDMAGAVKLAAGETAGFGWMEFPDKAAADAFNARMMSDPDVMTELGDMPFDGRRMIYGGFEVALETGEGGACGYVDGYVLPVRPERRDDYLAMARAAAAIFADHGVTRLVECWAADVPTGEVTDFPRAVLAAGGEVPVFSWCEWPDRATRDAGQAAIAADPRMKDFPAEMPFDGRRMIVGGFAVVSDTDHGETR